MIESITLRDFQKHKKLKVEFAPGVTTLVGKNSAGKSTVLRALKAVTTAGFRPSHLRHGAEVFSVRLGFDGHILYARRGRKKNLLKLDDKTYKATRKEVPPDVAALLAVGEENFQRQDQVHFWLSMPPGQVAAKLNELADLSLIDATLTRANAGVSRAKAAAAVSQDRLDAARKTVKSLAWAVKADETLKRAERLAREVEGAKARREQVEALLKDMDKARRVVAAGRKAIETGEDAVRLGEGAKAARVRRQGITSLLAELEPALKVARVKVPDIAAVDKAKADADAASERRREVEYLLQDYDQAARELKEAKAELEFLTTKRCPTCGQTVGMVKTGKQR